MSLILLGILNSQAAGAAATPVLEKIATTRVTSGNYVNFTIDTTDYAFLRVAVESGYQSGISGMGNLSVRFNGDTGGSNYGRHVARYSTNAGNNVFSSTSESAMELPGFMSRSNSDRIGYHEFDILDPSGAGYKQLIGVVGADNETNDGLIAYYTGYWKSTSAISSIQFSHSSSNWLNSRFTIYGAKIG